MAAFWAEQLDNPPIFDDERIAATKALFKITGRLAVYPQNRCYAVTDDGRVFTCRPCVRNVGAVAREMRLTVDKQGRSYVRVHDGKRCKGERVHRLVAAAFLPPPPAGCTLIRHLDGNNSNNHVENIAWGTHAENMEDMVRHGRSNRGRRNPNAKLNERTVRAVRILADEGVSVPGMAKLLGVTDDTVRRAVKGEQWGHVDAV